MNDAINILIAGCGTGHQIYQAQRYANARITAIDLSLSSLAYAQRKIEEKSINNVELIQMDILNLNLIQNEFDVIECGGVLHHMKEPEKGIEAIVDKLKPKGYLKLGLYSDTARKNVIKAREFILDNELRSTRADDIRKFRSEVLASKKEELLELSLISDFYTTSECRDLCFHVQEHRFNLTRIKRILEFYKLKFLGFILPKVVKLKYIERFPNDTELIDLLNWEKFEEENPYTFIGMYQFWVIKY